MQLPRGVDPDELLLSEGGPARWDALREAALPLIDHVIGVVANKYDLKSAHGKSDAVGDLSLFVREIGDAVQRAHYIQRVAAALRVPEDAVQEAIGRARGQGYERQRGAVRGQRRDDRRPTSDGASQDNSQSTVRASQSTISPEEHLLGLVLLYPQVTWMAGAPLIEDFTRLENRLVYEAVAEAAASSDKSAVSAAIIRDAALDTLDPALHPHIGRMLAREEPELFRFALPYELETRLKRLRQYNDRMWLQQCQVMMQEAQETGDRDTLSKLLPLLTRSLSRFRHYDPKPSTVFRDSRD
jgi:DNA primase